MAKPHDLVTIIYDLAIALPSFLFCYFLMCPLHYLHDVTTYDLH